MERGYPKWNVREHCGTHDVTKKMKYIRKEVLWVVLQVYNILEIQFKDIPRLQRQLS